MRKQHSFISISVASGFNQITMQSPPDGSDNEGVALSTDRRQEEIVGHCREGYTYVFSNFIQSLRDIQNVSFTFKI